MKLKEGGSPSAPATSDDWIFQYDGLAQYFLDQTGNPLYDDKITGKKGVITNYIDSLLEPLFNLDALIQHGEAIHQAEKVGYASTPYNAPAQTWAVEISGLSQDLNITPPTDPADMFETPIEQEVANWKEQMRIEKRISGRKDDYDWVDNELRDRRGFGVINSVKGKKDIDLAKDTARVIVAGPRPKGKRTWNDMGEKYNRYIRLVLLA